MAAAPSVTSIKPQSGRAEGGDVVVIKGTGFKKDETEVSFGGQSAVSVTVENDTEITAFSPAGTGRVDVTVRTPAGTSATTGASKFTYQEASVTSAISGARKFTDRKPEPSFRAALVAIAPIIPGIAMAIMVAAYYLYQNGPMDRVSFSLSTGILSGLAAWLSISGLYYAFGFTASDGANARSYSDLCDSLRKLDVQLNGSCLEQGIKPHERAWGEECISKEKCASREACSLRDAAKSELTKGGLQWVLGTGYVNMYSLVHHAEEALIECEPNNIAIVEGALNDELRLQGSDIRNSDDLLTKLRRAVRLLNPEAARFLNQQPPIEGAPSSEEQAHSASSASETKGSGQTDSEKAMADAKKTMRVVRTAIDGYRDDQRDGLVRARNHLLWVATIFGLITFTLLGVAIIWKVPEEALLTAAAFYLVGAAVGLFSRLHSQSAAHADVDDFGLFVVGLLASPSLSGSAAVFGVFLTAVLIEVGLLGSFWSPSAAPTATATVIPMSTAAASSMTLPSSPVPTNVPATPAATSTPGAPTPQNENRTPDDFSAVLSETYNIRTNPAGLIYAAIFGLTPNLLIGTLQQQSTSYKEQLKSSGPSNREGNAS